MELKNLIFVLLGFSFGLFTLVFIPFLPFRVIMFCLFQWMSKVFKFPFGLYRGLHLRVCLVSHRKLWVEVFSNTKTFRNRLNTFYIKSYKWVLWEQRQRIIVQMKNIPHRPHALISGAFQKWSNHGAMTWKDTSFSPVLPFSFSLLPTVMWAAFLYLGSSTMSFWFEVN